MRTNRTTDEWADWCIAKNQIAEYDPSQPGRVLGLLLGQGLTAAPPVGDTAIGEQSRVPVDYLTDEMSAAMYSHG